MRILVCLLGNICEYNLEFTLKSMGHDIGIFNVKIKNKDYDTEYLNKLSEELIKTQYDCVFSINYIPIISRICNVHQVKYISWVVDSPWFQLYSNTITNNCNFIFIFDRCLYEKFKNKFKDRIFYMPLGTNVRVWDSIKLSEEDITRFTTDVSFVGSLYEDKHDYDKVNISPYLRGYFDGIIQAQTNIYGYNFLNDVISDEAIKEFSKCANWNKIGDDYNVSDREIVISEFIGKKCAEVERHRFVDKLAKNFRFDLYTLSNTGSMQYINNRGPADSRIDMPKIFKCSKININMTIKTIESGIPLRTFDIMGNGGFVITNYQSELYDFFVSNEDLVIYDSLEDLIDKVSYYLKHEDERKKIAENGYQKVKLLHTYEKRFEQIFEIVWQNKSKCYGITSEKRPKTYLALLNLLNQLEVSRILDADMFLSNQSNIINQNGAEINNKYILDGLKIINNTDFSIKDTLYKHIYNLDNLPVEHYDIIIAIEVFRYLKNDEMTWLLKQLGQLTRVMITDYHEDYFVKLSEIKEYNLQKLQVSDCELLLITIN